MINIKNLLWYLTPTYNEKIWRITFCPQEMVQCDNPAKMEMQIDAACAMTEGSDNWPIRKLLGKNEGSSLVYNACVRVERRECGTSATRVRHKWR